MKSIAKRIIRLFLHRLIPEYSQKSWKFLRYYPHVIPTKELFLSWQQSEWIEYQKWIDSHSILSLDQWQTLHKDAKKWKRFPKISIVTPVYNTDANTLRLCILSVRIQTTPFWELILVDDGSSNKTTIEVLNSRLCKDPRIHILRSGTDKATGISAATNRGIDFATGDFITFLDHDDRLAPEAIQSVSEALRSDPNLDIVYSDRDMISEEGNRFMYLMKPNWSPETLYSGNYIFHLMCYRKTLIQKAGNLRSEYDGSQDYDLILRCMELTTNIKHIPQVLYHWRQHERSVAMNDDAKSYAFEAGIRALQDALQRRKIKGKVSEDKSLARGIYQVHLPPLNRNQIGIIRLPKEMESEQYQQTVTESDVVNKSTQPYILIQHEEYKEQIPKTVETMAAWLQLKSIGMISGCLLDNTGHFTHAGMIYCKNGQLSFPYSGYPFDEQGYMAVTKIVRNISGPDPFSVIIKRELWEQLGGLDKNFSGPHSLFDFALRSLQADWRILYYPQAIFESTNNFSGRTSLPKQDILLFKQRWKKWLQKGDPYYSPNLSSKSDCYELDLSQ